MFLIYLNVFLQLVSYYNCFFICYRLMVMPGAYVWTMAPFRRKPSRRSTEINLLILFMCIATCLAEENTTTILQNTTLSVTTEIVTTLKPSILSTTELAKELNSSIASTTPTTRQQTVKVLNTSSVLPKIVSPSNDTSQNFAESTTTANSSWLSTTVIPNPIQETCDGFNRLDAQPIHSEYAQVTKCNANDSIVISFAWAVFYENCIEDLDNATALPEEIYNPCSSGTHKNFIYGEDPELDLLIILQNGSLFRSNPNYTEYDIFDTYCLFTNEYTGQTMAHVCYDGLVSVSKAQAYLYAICKCNYIKELLLALI